MPDDVVGVVPDWAFFWTELYLETALLEREIRAGNKAALLAREAGSGDTGPDETTDTLRDHARVTFKDLVTNATRSKMDPFRTRNRLLKTATLMAADRLLTCSTGFALEAVGDPVAFLRIHVPPDRHQLESIEFRLLAVEGFGAGSDRPGDALDHATSLLAKQIETGDETARRRLGLHSDETSRRLEQIARDMLRDLSPQGDVCIEGPLSTKGKLLRLTALLAADRLLSHDLQISCQTLDEPERRVRIFAPAQQHPPESLELVLPVPPMR